MHRNKNIILDIDNTLIYSRNGSGYKKLNIYENPKNYDVQTRIFKLKVSNESMWSIKRPSIDKFFEYCFDNFSKVIIWTAGTKLYAQAVVEHLFRDHEKPYYILSRDDCEINKEDDPGILQKPISKITDNIDSTVNISNSFIVDDRNLVFEYCNPENGIIIPYYAPEINRNDIMKHEDSFDRLINFFESSKFRRCYDVRDCNLKNILNY